MSTLKIQAYLNTRSCKIWNFKFDSNRSLSFLSFTSYRWKIKMSSHEKFFSSRKAFDLPDKSVIFRCIFGWTYSCLEFRRVGVRWNRNDDFNIISRRSSLELRFSLNIYIILEKVVKNSTLIMYSTLEREYLSTTASIHISGFTTVVRRYDINSNSPSGGIKLIVRSFSKRDRRTHWWNLMSSSSTDLLVLPPETPI